MGLVSTTQRRPQKVKTRKYYRIEEKMKLAKKYNKIKKMKMDVGESPNQINFINYKEKENMKKAQIVMESEVKIVENHNREEKCRNNGGSRGSSHL